LPILLRLTRFGNSNFNREQGRSLAGSRGGREAGYIPEITYCEGSIECIPLNAGCVQEWGAESPGKIAPSSADRSYRTAIAHNARRWIYHLGGLGFIPLGLLDASIIPVPGSMDVLTIVLCARRSDMWIYYAIMATTGSVLGGFATYRLARKGGKEMMARRFKARTRKQSLTRSSSDGDSPANRPPRPAATTGAYGSIRARCRSPAIFGAEIPDRAHLGQGGQIPRFWGFWLPVTGAGC